MVKLIDKYDSNISNVIKNTKLNYINNKTLLKFFYFWKSSHNLKIQNILI